MIKDIEKECRGAAFILQREIRFDSEGGDRILTPVSQLESWMEEVAEYIR